MKKIILIVFVLLCMKADSQPVNGMKPTAVSTRFMSVSEKLQKLSANPDLLKMKPNMGVILSPGKMTASNKWALAFGDPTYVTVDEVYFYKNTGEKNSQLRCLYPANVGGTYVFEINLALYSSVKNFEFKIYCQLPWQVVSLYNNAADDTYGNNKLLFAVTIPNTAGILTIYTSSGSWKFVNCEITRME